MGRAHIQIAGVLLLAALVAAVPAGRSPLWDSNEARYALLARDVLEHGNWLVAHLRGAPYVYKPQLLFWLIAALSWPGGQVTPWTAALPSVMATVAAAGGVVAVGRLLWGGTAGVLAGLIFATTPLVFVASHEAVPDGLLNAAIVWALYVLLRGAAQGWPQAALLAFSACCLTALLVKGPAALMLLVAVGAILPQLERPPVLRIALAGALAIGAAALVWLVPYAAQAPTALGQEAMKGEYLQWFWRWSLRSRIPSLYAPLAVFLPWTLLLAAVPWCWRASPDRGRRVVIAWTIALWAVVAVSGRYRAKYLLPVCPGLALLAAELLTARLGGAARAARRAALLGAAPVAALGALVAAWPGARRLVDLDNQPYLLEAPWEWAVSGVAVALAVLALLAAARRDAPALGALGLALAMGIVLLVEGLGYPARRARLFDVRPLARVAAARVPAAGTVLGYPDLRLAYDFYLPGRRILEVYEPARLAAGLWTAGAIIAPASRRQELAEKLPLDWTVVAQRDVGGRPILVLGRR